MNPKSYPVRCFYVLPMDILALHRERMFGSFVFAKFCNVNKINLGPVAADFLNKSILALGLQISGAKKAYPKEHYLYLYV